MNDQVQTTAQVVGQAALATAEAMLPIIIEGVTKGAAASTPQGAIISMVAVIIESLGMNSDQIERLLTVTYAKIQVNQAQIDAVAAARGIVDPTVMPETAAAPAAPVPAEAPAAASATVEHQSV